MTKIVKPTEDRSTLLAVVLGEVFARMAAETPPAEWDGLRQSHLRVLTTIADGGSRVTDLAVTLRMTKQGAGQLVQTLVAAGLARAEPGRADRRVRLVVRTPAGDALCSRLHARFEELEAQWAAEVGVAEYAVFRRIAERLAVGAGTGRT